MIITKMTASFGRLERETLEPTPGLTVIQAPNEGGKSTWAAFLRVMLYGIDTRERDKRGTLADKNRFRPWSGAPMEGVLECRWQDRPVVLRRYTKGAIPMGAFSAVWGDSGAPVEDMTGENAGEMLTGVSREVFERSAFLRQSGLAVDQTPELERRIAALVTSGEEDVSFSQTEGRLREWLRRRKFHQNGQIPKLEGELSQVEATLRDMDHATVQIAAARGELEELTAGKTRLEGELELHRRVAQLELNRRYAAARQVLEQAAGEEEELRGALYRHGVPPTQEALRKAQDDLACLRATEATLRQPEPEEDEQLLLAQCRDGRFPDLSLEKMWETAQQDDETVRIFRENRRRRNRWIIPLILGAAAVGLLLGWLLWLKYPNLPILALVVLLSVPALANSVRRTVTRQAERAEQTELEELLQQHQVADGDEILPKARQVLEAAQEAREERDKTVTALMDFVHSFAPEVNELFGASAAVSRMLTLLEREKVAALRREGAQQLADALAAQGGQEGDTLELLPSPEIERDVAVARLGAVNSELARVQSLLDIAQGEQNALGDPAVLMARAGELHERLAVLGQDYAALETALEALGWANEQLRGRFSPALNERAGELMERLTQGKYPKVSLDRSFDATVEEAGQLALRPMPALSQGTADQLYLAVRLAICQLALPEDQPCPLVLDDTLANFDDSRAAAALELLRQLAEKRQILLFTCHSREAAHFAGDPSVGVATLPQG